MEKKERGLLERQAIHLSGLAPIAIFTVLFGLPNLNFLPILLGIGAITGFACYKFLNKKKEEK